MGKKIFHILLACVACVLCHSCIQDGFTTSSSDVLAFSCDSVKFDTVFTDLGTPTKQFVVYNRHKKQLHISSIRVVGGNHNFRINVDGRTGTQFNNIEVRGEDSIYVFVECYLDENQGPEPIETTDKIEFITNGVTQSVTLNAWGQDVTRLKNVRVPSGEELHLTTDLPYVIFDSLTVEQGARLVVDPGTIMYFHSNAKLRIDGQISALGTVDKNIVMRGDRTDNVVGKYSFDLMSGQWWGMQINATSHGNEMAYVNMRSSVYGLVVTGDEGEEQDLHLFNCLLHNTMANVLCATDATIAAEGCEFSDAAGAVVQINGGNTHFIHCTFANYYLFAVPMDVLLFIDMEEFKLKRLYADNCIFKGMSSSIYPGEFQPSDDVRLRYCLFPEKGTDDANFLNCVWEADPLFYVQREKYIFDYRVKNESPAIGAGSVSLCPESARYDRYGCDRLVRGNIDIGAYTWIPAEEEKK